MSIVTGNGYMVSGEGTPVVMVPGMDGCKEFWISQLEALSAGYMAVACDLPVRRPSTASRISDYAAEVLRIMDELKIESAVLVGESMGGMVIQEIAVNHRERVKALILCNSFERPRRGGFGFNMFTLATFAHLFAFLPFLSDRLRLRLMLWVGKHRGFIFDPSPGNVWFLMYLLKYATANGSACFLDRAIAVARENYTDRLPSIEVPALVLRGTEDRLVTEDDALELAGRLPKAEVALVDGGGHCCPYTVPEKTNDAILEWLNRAVHP